ncbi:MAG: transketolase [Proteobacteria bacterium]|nr:transketolase [Pseudomonadota bacterium]
MSSNQTFNDLSPLDQLCINTIRFLAVDAVQKANSGHPGLPMGMAPAVFKLFTEHLRFNPKNPQWANRDRFILSAGHGSALLYSILHLCGYDLPLDEIKQFRQLNSKTPGHPEYGHTAGVEATTGPLGQGISNAVGLAIAEKYLSNYFNKPDFPIIDHNIYVLSGDGCLQEGIAAEACSLAGHLGLDNLIVIYDDNEITIDGRTDIAFTEDVAKRFDAYGWKVLEIGGDGHSLDALNEALEKAKAENNRPTIIKFKSIIGFGSPNKQDTSGVHGSPLGPDEVKLAKESLGWAFEEDFYIPLEASDFFSSVISKAEQSEADWSKLVSGYKAKFPELGKELEAAMAGKLPVGWESNIPQFEAGSSLATRVASGKFLEAVMPSLPFVLGGSADLTPSNNTRFSAATVFQKDNPNGRYLHFGVREHAMGAILNGVSLNGMLKAYGATFLCFSDYMLPAIRVAALSGYKSLFVFTHDSIGLGEDGPTHQPVEQTSYLRAMPGLISFRPADANETSVAWQFALKHKDGPVALSLTRQGLPVLDQEKYGKADQVEKGAYVLLPAENADLLLIATGSEVSLALEAAEVLQSEGKKVQVVSMPCCELFEMQSKEYQNSVIPESVVARVVVEAGIRRGWEGYLGSRGEFVGMTGFGASAPGKDLFIKFGITVEAIVAAAKKVL